MAKNDENISKNKWPLYVSLIIIAGLIVSYFLVSDVKEFMNNAWDVLTSDDEQRITTWVNGFGWFGPVVLILAMIVQMFLIIIPTVLLMVVSILAYGPIWGSLIVLAAVFSASTVGYFIGNYFGKNIVLKLLGQKTEDKIEAFIDNYGFWAVIVTRLNPFLSNDAISFVGGMLKMGYWRFIGATLIGILPLTIFIAIVGENTDSLKSSLLWGSIVCLVAFGIYVYWDKSRKKKSK
ncbi:TVP38/TMEM64 family protein [Winogradskyella schleiferi]|uniref:TVP38/TMEM64 family protein n=1 Tax=Winogradskyella schleiferi TaxID=2686078 RepID=UPI0015BAD0C7|nr:TVP38/TMEM64 family protein [Winogradskyella schleiferi]